MFIPPFHTEENKIVDSRGDPVTLRGFDFIELTYEVDKLREGGTVEQRARQFKALGISLIRLETDYDNWNSNLDTNGDGVGNRDFTIHAIDVLTSKGICVIPGLHGSKPLLFTTDYEAWADWIVTNLVEPFINNPYVIGVYIMNEPKYAQFGGDNLGGSVTSGYWNAAKLVCARINEANPNLLMVVAADMVNGAGFCPILKTDPIPTPNVVYTWHYYFPYCPAFNTYHPWGSLDPDPTYEDCKQRGQPYYQSYAAGNYEQAYRELEQTTYDRFLWVSEELGLPIIMDEFGFNGDEIPYFSRRKCPNGDWDGKVKDCLDENGNSVRPPYTGTVYCPVDNAAIPQPAPYGEPGWPQCFKDYLSILNKYDIPWAYFGWWPKVYGGYGMVEHDMTTLSKIGKILRNYLPTPISPIITLESIAVGSIVGLATIPLTKNPLISAVLALGGFTADILIRRAGRGTSEEAFDFLY